MAKPPPGVDDVFAAVTVLLAGVLKTIPCAKGGKVQDKNKTWDAAKKALLTDVKGFLDQLLAFKDAVDTYQVRLDKGQMEILVNILPPLSQQVPDGNWRDVRPYLDLPHFNAETIRSKNSVAAGLCSWVIVSQALQTHEM